MNNLVVTFPPTSEMVASGGWIVGGILVVLTSIVFIAFLVVMQNR